MRSGFTVLKLGNRESPSVRRYALKLHNLSKEQRFWPNPMRVRGSLKSATFGRACSLLLAPLLLTIFSQHATGVYIDAEELVSLAEMKTAFEPYKTTLDSWNATLPCEHWLGLTCNSEGHVTSISILGMSTYTVNATLLSAEGDVAYEYDMNSTYNYDFYAGYPGYAYVDQTIKYIAPLNGTISPFVGNLSSLESFIITSQSLTGIIPSEIGKLVNLKVLNLSNNGLEGPLPASLGNLSELVILDVNSNGFVGDGVYQIKSINGTLPPELGNLGKLQWLALGGNNISGEVPASFAKLTELRHLDLFGLNPPFPGLSGDIAAALPASLTHLQHLDLTSNGFTGQVPSTIGNFVNLTFLSLSSNKLTGPLPEEMGLLTKLQSFQAQANNLTALPQSMGNLTSLVELNMIANNISSLPSSLASLENLKIMKLSECGFEGAFPDFSKYTKLELLDLGFNYMTTSGGIPAYFANFTKLNSLALDFNTFSGGFPSHLLGLTHLDTLSCGSCNLSGPLPSDIGVSNLSYLIMPNNGFSGPIPDSIGDLPSIVEITLSNNQLSGWLPSSLGDLMQLETLDLRGNQLSGAIPSSFGQLFNLSFLYLGNNMLNSIPDSFASLSLLSDLDLSSNNFTTPVPEVLCGLGMLSNLILSNNAWGGSLPVQIAHLNESLTTFLCRSCGLSGSIPEELELFSSLTTLDLGGNNFLGSLNGSFFQSFKSMQTLSLRGSSLLSTIPPVGKMTSLLSLDLGGNDFQGPLPRNLPASLVALDLSNNKLSGNLTDGSPFEKLVNLQSLLLGGNDFSGPVPDVFSSPSSQLSFVSLSGTGLTGAIESNYLAIGADLSGTPACTSLYNPPIYCQAGRLSPDSFQRNLTTSACSQAAPCYSKQNFFSPVLLPACSCAAPLYANFTVYPAVVQFYSADVDSKVVNFFATVTGLKAAQVVVASAVTNANSSISFGLLVFGTSASPPPARYTGVLQNILGQGPANISGVGTFAAYTFLNRTRLEYAPPPPPPSLGNANTLGLKSWEIILIAVASAFTLGIAVFTFTYKPREGRLTTLEKRIQENQVRKMTLKEIQDATNNFHESSFLGEGGFAKVYKGSSPKGVLWAVKRAKEVGEVGGDFDTEIEMLSLLHHTNVVALIGYHGSKREQVLVYEYMGKGTVKDHIGQKKGVDVANPLSFETRLNIALGAAEGLRYLHNFTNPPFIHRDIKSANILLDDDYVAKVADFGLLRENRQGGDAKQKMAVVGTFGYIDPEYFCTQKVSTKSDVFSFGVFLLELITGRSAVFWEPDESGAVFATSLASWVQPYFDRPTMIIDPALNGEYNDRAMRNFVTLAFNCVERSAIRRPTMNDVARRLSSIWNILQGIEPSTSTGLVSASSASESGFGGDIILGNSDISASRTLSEAPLTTAFDGR
eukprot:TRINITY_DN54_c0_g1_i1.p1 TRINITY_DN54_c0_g1~~TRINITY_DN54_c0_g1_i1.p1  ORF type:complete len:1407 (+),score=237.75 TRINITY_DN54_c0_g1_i1:39-4259(+)